MPEANDLSFMTTDQIILDLQDASKNLEIYNWHLRNNKNPDQNILKTWKETIEYIEALSGVLKTRH